MKKAFAAFALSLVLLFAAGRMAYSLAEDEYMEFDDEQYDAFFEFDEDGTDEYHAGVFPCWFFKGEQMRFADEAEIGVSPIRDLYRIPDGHWFYGD